MDTYAVLGWWFFRMKSKTLFRWSKSTLSGTSYNDQIDSKKDTIDTSSKTDNIVTLYMIKILFILGQGIKLGYAEWKWIHSLEKEIRNP